MTKKLLALLLLMFSVSSFAETDHDQHHANMPAGLWPGVYQGFTPCEDCKGIKTSLALNKNNTYILIRQYVGKSPKDVVEKGTFAWESDSNTLVLTPRNASPSHQYFVEDNALMQLDDSGHRFTKDVEHYELRKADMTKETQSHSGH